MRKLIAFGALLALAAAVIGCGKKDDGALGGNNDRAKGGLFSDVSSRFPNGGKMQAVIDDYVREVVEEAKGVRVIYTNGVFDDDIRREAKRRGIELEPVSIMARNGALALAMAVERGEDVALQLGFELLKRRYCKELPPCSGVLARTGKMPEEDRQRGIDAARCLGERILELYRKDAVRFGGDEDLKKRFLAVQWRIARLATMRAERADHAQQTELSQQDKTLADELDNNNSLIQDLRRALDQAEALTIRAITPSRGLRMSLAQADFTQAKRYAELILASNPDNTDANFAMGMSYYVQKQWARAEKYFRRYLTKKEDAAVLNNLAVICMYTERYDEGLKLAYKALELIPQSAEVKDTIKQIKEAKEKAKEEAAEPKPVSTNTSKPLPPREQMEQAIGRGDYAAAAKFAAPILRTNPDDAYANFAVGMDHFGKQEWDRAVTHLTRCVKQSPDEPVFLNNLAITLLYKGRYDEALKHAQKALKLQPDSEVVQDTINQIKKARAKLTPKKADAKKAEN